jgi:hypothetical protein
MYKTIFLLEIIVVISVVVVVATVRITVLPQLDCTLDLVKK